ncbi:MAG: OmpH family outer membrane protein [Maricaulaceae bacterium]
MLIFKTFNRLSLIVLASIIFAGSAAAQSTILIIDQKRIMRDSEVGKHITRQLESIAKTMESEIKASATPFESERTRLITELNSIGQEGLKTRPDLQKKAQDLAVKGQQAKTDAAYKQRELQITEAKALQQVNNKLAEILKTIVAERNADVVLERSVVIYGDGADVTDTVISRLNSQMRTISVTRERLPRQAAPK